MWVNTKSSQPKSATSRYAAARSTRKFHSAALTVSFTLRIFACVALIDALLQSRDNLGPSARLACGGHRGMPPHDLANQHRAANQHGASHGSHAGPQIGVWVQCFQ